MKIEQITKAEHERRIVPWFQRAVNDPTVHPFLGMGTWRGTPAPEDSDWSKAYFMDDSGVGLLSVGLDHQLCVANLCLWVLDGNQPVAAALMRYAIRTVPKRFGMRHLAFVISDSNAAWRNRAMRAAGKWMWGRETDAVYDTATGRLVDCLHFKVPVSALARSKSLPPVPTTHKETA
jgi:hypothetical protein